MALFDIVTPSFLHVERVHSFYLKVVMYHGLGFG